jgi:nucleotide-binding universal stress UspA family protein
MFHHILLPVDFSEISEHAARCGIELAHLVGAMVTIITVTTPWAVQFAREPAVVVPGVVVPEQEYEAKATGTARNVLTRLAKIANSAGVVCDTLHVRHSEPYVAIVETAAKQGCDLVIMASRAAPGLAGVLLGSTTSKVVSHAKIPVLVYRQG